MAKIITTYIPAVPGTLLTLMRTTRTDDYVLPEGQSAIERSEHVIIGWQIREHKKHPGDSFAVPVVFPNVYELDFEYHVLRFPGGPMIGMRPEAATTLVTDIDEFAAEADDASRRWLAEQAEHDQKARRLGAEYALAFDGKLEWDDATSYVVKWNKERLGDKGRRTLLDSMIDEFYLPDPLAKELLDNGHYRAFAESFIKECAALGKIKPKDSVTISASKPSDLVKKMRS